MKNKQIINQNNNLKVLLEIEDLQFGKIKRCVLKNRIVYIIQDKIVYDKEVTDRLEIKYGFMIPNKLKNIIY